MQVKIRLRQVATVTPPKWSKSLPKTGFFEQLKRLISVKFQISDNSSMAFGAGMTLRVARVRGMRVAESDEAV
jgi:hypothetical protein